MPELTPQLSASSWAIATCLITLCHAPLPVSAKAFTTTAATTVAAARPSARLAVIVGAVASNPTCPGMNTDDRRVASGSVSTRWIYWVLQNPARQYYVAYWPQHDCTQSRRTTTYSTQREAYSAFMCQYIQERCNP